VARPLSAPAGIPAPPQPEQQQQQQQQPADEAGGAGAGEGAPACDGRGQKADQGLARQASLHRGRFRIVTQ
jgi:hypothetical protein